MFASDDSAKKI